MLPGVVGLLLVLETNVQDVNRLIKQFREVQKLMKTMQKTGGRGLPKLFG